MMDCRPAPRSFLLFLPVLVLGSVAWARVGYGAPESPLGDVPDRTAVIGESIPTAPVEFTRTGIGRSRALYTRQVMPGQKFAAPLSWKGSEPLDARYRWVRSGQAGPMLPYEPVLRAPEESGVYNLEITQGAHSEQVSDFHLIVKLPRGAMRNGRINGYRIGEYPESGVPRTGPYALPEGFIEVNREDVGLKLSKHFTVGEFLTKNQSDVWPKYVIVDARLLDKLELVLEDLEKRGIPARHMVIMSGYRTPQYNGLGVGSGRAKLSRHQYGDAADVWVDNDRDWYMDDLNGDGRRDTRDAQVILESVERVEAEHPQLIGGAEIYRDNGAHGPFIHIDTRGRRARW